jgi:hypothetical protein
MAFRATFGKYRVVGHAKPRGGNNEKILTVDKTSIRIARQK